MLLKKKSLCAILYKIDADFCFPGQDTGVDKIGFSVNAADI